MHHLQIVTLFLSLCSSQLTVVGDLIINGKEVADDKVMRYMASVENIQGRACGGILVSEDFVLTAARCESQQPRTVILGTHNLRNKKKKTMKIARRFPHPSYERNKKEGVDLMLLQLTGKVQLGNGLNVTQFPKENIGDKCEVAGWGATKINDVPVRELRTAKVSIVDAQTCKKAWKNLPHNVICAKGEREGRIIDEADSGGPLVCDGIPVGIASFNTWDRKEGPCVFVSIFPYLDWIKGKIHK